MGLQHQGFRRIVALSLVCNRSAESPNALGSPWLTSSGLLVQKPAGNMEALVR